MAEAAERDGWDRDRWTDWLDEARRVQLRRAATLPGYTGASGGEDLASWPVLDKARLREDPEAFVDPGADDLYEEHTSGTTGTPLRLWWDRRAVRGWYGLVEARARGWHGVSRHDRWALLGGQLVVPAHRRRPPYGVWNAALHQLYLSAWHLSPDTAGDYAAHLRKVGPTHLLGYPSALATLARLCPRRRPRAAHAPGRADQRRAAARPPTGGRSPRRSAARSATPTAWPSWSPAPPSASRARSTSGRRSVRSSASTATSWPPACSTGPCRWSATGSATGWPARCAGRRARAAAACPRSPGSRAVTTTSSSPLTVVASAASTPSSRPTSRSSRRRSCRRRRTGSGCGSCPPDPSPTTTVSVLVRRVRDHVGEMDVVIDELDRIERDAAGKFRAVVSEVDRD